jgi:hypothetical protein
MDSKPPHHRRHPRQQLVLKVEFDAEEGFRSNYLNDLSRGGLRVGFVMELGQRHTLHISFLGFVERIEIEAVVQWTLPASHPGGPASGLAFTDLTEEASAWLSDVLDASTVVRIVQEVASKVVMLVAQPFLREVYGQEVRNWAELRDEEPLDLRMFDNPAHWFDEVTRSSAVLGIIDVDDQPDVDLSLYHRVRHNRQAAELPLILIGAPENVEPFARVADDLLLCLRKPLKFGALMNTVRVLARDPAE